MIPFVLLLIWIWTASLYTDITWLGVSSSSEWWHVLTFSFIHSSFLHLAVNSFILVFYARAFGSTRMAITLPIVIISTMIAGFLAAVETPTVGASALAMAMLGVLVGAMPVRFMARPLITITLCFTISGLFAKGINTPVHIYAFLLSFLAALPFGRRLYK